MPQVDESLVVDQVHADLRSGRARRIRLSAGWSQADVARALRTDVRVVSRWETGRSSPRPYLALELGSLLDKLNRMAREEP